jgi:hypothetical protein
VSTSNDPRQSPNDGRAHTNDVRIRRAPKYATFLILGGGLGAVVTFILTALYPVDPNVGFGALFGYFALYGVTAGVVLGAVIAIILDRRSDRHASSATAVIEVTEAPQPETPADTSAHAASTFADPEIDARAAHPAQPGG